MGEGVECPQTKTRKGRGGSTVFQRDAYGRLGGGGQLSLELNCLYNTRIYIIAISMVKAR